MICHYSTRMETFKVSEYKAEAHDKFIALGLDRDLAEKVTTAEYEIDGEPVAQCSVILQKSAPSYRGDVLVGAVGDVGYTHNTELISSYLCGFVELYDIKPCRGLTPDEWKGAGIPARADRAKWYAWFLRNPRRVIEMPCAFKRGLHTLIIPKDQITEYPRIVYVGTKDWERIRAKYGLR